ncbi:hypothetical protein B0H14DRAFT_2599215 [Mycena olivaceomarginata]|nr:hypothetical protein B0H14DRAFT_2599215 [Mycena olivaceomarginata]
MPKFAFPNSHFPSPTSRVTSGSLSTELVFWRDKASQSEIHSDIVSERFTREGGNSSASTGFSIGLMKNQADTNEGEYSRPDAVRVLCDTDILQWSEKIWLEVIIPGRKQGARRSPMPTARRGGYRRWCGRILLRTVSVVYSNSHGSGFPTAAAYTPGSSKRSSLPNSVPQKNCPRLVVPHRYRENDGEKCTGRLLQGRVKHIWIQRHQEKKSAGMSAKRREMGAITIRLPARETYRAEPALLVIDTTVNSGSEWGLEGHRW